MVYLDLRRSLGPSPKRGPSGCPCSGPDDEGNEVGTLPGPVSSVLSVGHGSKTGCLYYSFIYLYHSVM